jgi:hypothetical protein
MNTLLTVRETLLDYDGPALMLMSDSSGNEFIVYQDLPGSGYDYVGVSTSESKARAMTNGNLSVRDAILASPLYPRFMHLSLDNDSDEFRLTGRLSEEDIRPEQLPAATLTLSPSFANEAIVSRSKSRSNLTATLSLQPEEAERRHVVHIDTLADMLKSFQRLLRRAVQQTTKALPLADKHRIRSMHGDTFNAIAFGPGSFEVFLEPDSPGDLFGQNDSAGALRLVTNLMKDAASTQATIVLLREYRGHFASAYLRLLESVAMHAAPTALSWSDASGELFGGARISVDQANNLIAAIKASVELVSEEVTVSGALVQANKERGKWKLRASTGELHSGEASDEFSLEGKTIGRLYTFTCREVIEEEAGTGKETVRLYAFADVTPNLT